MAQVLYAHFMDEETGFIQGHTAGGGRPRIRTHAARVQSLCLNHNPTAAVQSCPPTAGEALAQVLHLMLIMVLLQ